MAATAEDAPTVKACLEEIKAIKVRALHYSPSAASMGLTPTPHTICQPISVTYT